MGILDWINFGLGMASATASVSNAKRLEQMQREGAEAAVIQALLNVLRDLVFDSREKLKTIEPLATEDPMPVFAMARTVEWRLTTLGITPAIFPEFRDKEYVQETLNQLERIEKTSYGRMTPDQRQQAEACALALHEMPLLEKAVTSETAREQYNATERERSSLTSQKSSYMLGGIAAMLVACPICAVSAMMPGSFLGIVGGLVGLLVLGAGATLFIRSQKPPRLLEIETQRAKLKPDIADADTQKQIEQHFGKQTSQGYLALRDERQALIESTFSSLENNKLLLA